MHQITGAIIATTLVTVAIYVPIAFFGGMVGNIYMQFSVTMCVALCLSAINSLTLSPALCVLLLKGSKRNRAGSASSAPSTPLWNGRAKLYQMRRHHGAPRVAYADSAGRCPGRQLETV